MHEVASFRVQEFRLFRIFLNIYCILLVALKASFHYGREMQHSLFLLLIFLLRLPLQPRKTFF